MYGLTQLGVIHTLISLVAVAAGVAAFARYGRIDPASRTGKVYVYTTILTCLTGFGIFAHGGFGKPHALGVITLLTLGLAWWADRGKFGARSEAVSVCAYSITFLFHMIPAITETSTRLPLGSPLLADAEAPELKIATGLLLLLCVAGTSYQLRRLNRPRETRPAAAA
ncbi:hypothetical protein [Duganella sp. S19_KUP01_CR8]|uniref:hypothetical protein n=1 Tax=Duganella sp. S19_KUP01_CR8 TaxID=3025502 RepID=UPI002FCD7C86